MILKIDCFVSIGCASEIPLRENIASALEVEETDAEVRFHYFSEAEAAQLGFQGSPTIRINGVDILPAEASGFS